MTVKSILYISASSSRDSVVHDSLRVAAAHLGFRVLLPEDAASHPYDAMTPWAAIRHADLIVAFVTKNSNNVFYEVGFAHGLGKPVVLVTANPDWTPVDLRGQRIVKVGSTPEERRALSFNLERSISALLSEKNKSAQWGGDTGRLKAEYTRKGTAHRDWVIDASVKWDSDLEGRVANVLNRVQGWDVLQASVSEKTRAFDFIVWNHIEDPLLAGLGNPIAVEVKGSGISKDIVMRLAGEAHKQGLGAFVLVTNTRTTHSVRASLARVARSEGVLAIILDIKDIALAESSNELPEQIRERIIEIRSV